MPHPVPSPHNHDLQGFQSTTPNDESPPAFGRIGKCPLHDLPCNFLRALPANIYYKIGALSIDRIAIL